MNERFSLKFVKTLRSSGEKQVHNQVMLVDTHAHIYLDRFDDDRDAMLERSRAAGLGAIIMPAIDVASIYAALELSEAHDDLFAMAAIHPSETREADDRMFEEIVSLCDEKRIVAVGETGLDYYWDRTFDDQQQRFFRRHIQLALALDLPLVIHNRDAGDDIVQILSEELDAAGRQTMKGVFHCFGGPAELGRKAVSLGFHLGIGGTLTFKNAGVSAAIDQIDLDHIVLETDSPFLAPAPHRGKRNEPAYVAIVAERLAQDRGLSVEDVAARTTKNARELFRMKNEE